MDKFCFSCSAPLSSEEFKGPAEDFCQYCTDHQGNLKPREEIMAGVAGWFMSWQPDLDEETARKRAELFIKSMPAWAD
jgi:hypothetical protein